MLFDELGGKQPIDCGASLNLSLLKPIKGPHVPIFGLQHVFRHQANGAQFPHPRKARNFGNWRKVEKTAEVEIRTNKCSIQHCTTKPTGLINYSLACKRELRVLKLNLVTRQASYY